MIRYVRAAARGQAGHQAVTARRSRFNRAGWVLAALLQLLAPAFATVADARAEGESHGAHAHIEAHGTPSCARAHEADCILCRIIAAGAPPANQPVPTRIPATLNELAARRETSCTPTRLAGDPPQRAPPV